MPLASDHGSGSGAALEAEAGGGDLLPCRDRRTIADVRQRLSSLIEAASYGTSAPDAGRGAVFLGEYILNLNGDRFRPTSYGLPSPP